jgi:hypothetical protein
MSFLEAMITYPEIQKKAQEAIGKIFISATNKVSINSLGGPF